MRTIINILLSYLAPSDKCTIGLSSFRVKKQRIAKTPKPKIKEKSSLNFSLLH